MPADTSCDGFCGLYASDTMEELPEDPGVFEYEGGGWIVDNGTAHPYQPIGVLDNDGFTWMSVSSLLEMVEKAESFGFVKAECFPRKWGSDRNAPRAKWKDIIPLTGRSSGTALRACK